MTTGRRPEPRAVLAMALGVVGAGLLVVAEWQRLLRDRGRVDPLLVVLMAAGVLVLIGVVFGWFVRRGRLRHRVVAGLRPGWTLHEVWADESLGRGLVAQGVWERGLSLAGGTRFTLAWSASGVELWRGGRAPHEVLSLPWHAIASVTEGSGYAASSARPAVVVSTVAHATLVLVPCARLSGGVLPAGAAQVGGLVAAMRSARGEH
ncbi:MAG: hypothetical protein HHJ14_13360 [Cellulomonas sp.]|nr:hypothetical protein [Cellulomonas sp.]